MRSPASGLFRASALVAALAYAPAVLGRSTFVLEVTDPDGVGFKDTTPATPVGGNTGTTLGEQRRIAVKYALDTWSKLIDSTVPVVVEASFAPLNCTANYAVVAQASSTGYEFGVSGLEANTIYVEALADRVAGTDLNPGFADVQAEFNGDLATCLSGVDWYYGLDGKAGANADLLYTALHEIAHGLGFTYLPDPATGALLGGMHDAYERHLLNNATGRHFNEMSNSERVASVGAPRQVVWDGQYATAAAQRFLASGAPKLTASPAVSGFYAALVEANFGPSLPTQPISGSVVLGNPRDGCSPLAALNGAIALLYQGSCHPMNMSYYAQQAGARAVLMADNQPYTPPIAGIEVRLADVNALPITIPTVGLGPADADLLNAAGGETVTLVADTNQRVGADPAGHVYMYASVPNAAQSTLSHWDPLTRPNLVLEPTGTPDHPHDLTLEQALLRDIGWEPLCGNGRVDQGEECDNGSANSDTQADACRTSCVKAACGDQVVDTGEQCDDGTANDSDTRPDACRTSCVKAACGDGVVDTGEQCDDGAKNGTLGACGRDCRLMSVIGKGGSGGMGAGASGSAALTAQHHGACSCRTASAESRWGWLTGLLVAVLGGVRRSARKRREQS
jgi:MYXO-CTERM domain-containing protein